jgi:type IV pilus assembly protein PilP
MQKALSIPVLVAVLAGCSSAPAPAPMGTAPAAYGTAPALAATEAAEQAPPRMPVDENALNESDRSRDPFRASQVTAPPPPRDTIVRKSRNFSVEELQLVGVVTRLAEPRAMLVDPRGKGWIVGVGDVVGRAEIVHGATADRTTNWRVDRIRERQVVLVRDDAYLAGSEAATRVLAMRQEKTLDEED